MKNIAVITCLICAVILSLSAAAVAVDKAAVLDRKFEAELRAVAEALDGVMGYAIKDIKTGKTFLLNEDEVFPQASSIKIAILLEVFKRAEEGALNLDERLELPAAKKVAGSGILFYLSDPAPALSVRDLAVLMVVLSDNTATNLLIDRVGMDAVNKRLDGLGLPRTRLRRR
ncbi:MAG: serine hydrolase, partial [Candidatus Aminicenantes bacterium]|nr:serine hydrolase [Candidatus Aminicenantes bacterium]